MSRTFRSHGFRYFRRPHTENERKQLEGILHDPDLMEFTVSGLNHMKSREHQLPSSWDDMVISAYFEK